MARFSASLSDAHSSVRTAVVVETVAPDSLRIEAANSPDPAAAPPRSDLPFSVSITTCVFRPPLGRIRRVIELPGDRLLESDDLEAVDAIGKTTDANRGLRLVHLIESNWKLVIACIPVVIATVWLVYAVGIPIAAKTIAFKLPAAALVKSSNASIELLEFLMFDPSELDADRKKEITRGFDDVVRKLGSKEFDYQLHFRSANGIPNAMALPSGDIFVTDELIEVAGSDKEIFAVLAHELTHVEQRHGMRMVLQDSGIFFLSSVMLGDVVSASTLAAGVPTLLVESGYSRSFEDEADEGAGHYCLECGWGTAPMRRILKRISPESDNDGDKESFRALGWISSHPDTTERVRKLRELEALKSGKQVPDASIEDPVSASE